MKGSVERKEMRQDKGEENQKIDRKSFVQTESEYLCVVSHAKEFSFLVFPKMNLKGFPR